MKTVGNSKNRLHHIHNDEQYKFDVFKTNRIVKEDKSENIFFQVKYTKYFSKSREVVLILVKNYQRME